MKNKLPYWLPGLLVLIAAACIFCFSTGAFSAAVTEQVFGSYNFVARKLAHVSEYAILFLLSRSALSYLLPRRNPALVSVLAIVLACGYAATDEWHQTFVPGRTGSVHDMCIDWFGVLLGFGLYQAFQQIQERRQAL